MACRWWSSPAPYSLIGGGARRSTQALAVAVIVLCAGCGGGEHVAALWRQYETLTPIERAIAHDYMSQRHWGNVSACCVRYEDRVVVGDDRKTWIIRWDEVLIFLRDLEWAMEQTKADMREAKVAGVTMRQDLGIVLPEDAQAERDARVEIERDQGVQP